MLVVVDEPDALFARAIEAGGTIVAAIHEEHGWRTGRLVDPAGHTWEVARLLG